ncbi:hypothetical protein CNMCM6805_001907 [Aspergillus fumigatiaffinis]|uniref:Uncharacterized protein n=1 Tax=Aspergillus fumigatiaffinis TaxID=340414 RepID=A0A8H4GUV1_9EURO|nr:hypothetical protein CNMCM6805_001907 [Aspergillus fumigatiaffinis]
MTYIDGLRIYGRDGSIAAEPRRLPGKGSVRLVGLVLALRLFKQDLMPCDLCQPVPGVGAGELLRRLAGRRGVAGNELPDRKAKEAPSYCPDGEATNGWCGPLAPVTLPDRHLRPCYQGAMRRERGHEAFNICEDSPNPTPGQRNADLHGIRRQERVPPRPGPAPSGVPTPNPGDPLRPENLRQPSEFASILVIELACAGN